MVTFGILLVVLFTSGAIPATLGKPHMPSPHIQNGSTAKPHSHPWLLNMRYTFHGTPRFCGASLIRVPYSNDSSDIALTAAHCIGEPGTKECNERMKSPSEYTLVASDHDQDEKDIGEVSVSVAHSVCHPQWTALTSHTHDIAILKLAEPLKFSETIRAIELPRQGEEVPANSDCMAVGWGNTRYKYDEQTGDTIPEGPTRYLQEVPVRVATPDECSTILSNESIDNKIELCNRVVNNQTMLGGDSGSSLTCKRGNEKILYGIVAWGSYWVPFQPIIGNAFTKVSAFADWIREETGRLRVDG